MKMNTVFFTLALLVICVSFASAEVLKLDMGLSTAAGELESGYTAFTTGTNGSVINGVKVTFSGTIAGRRRTNPTGIPLEQIMRDFIFGNNSDVTITLEGLEPSKLYDVIMYSFDTDSNGNRQAVWTGNSQPLFTTLFKGEDVPVSGEDYKFSGTARSDASGTLVLKGVKGPQQASGQTHYCYINALIVDKGDQCTNNAPAVQLASYSTVNLDVTSSIQLDLTATDDGKPYTEGCTQENPDVGTPYGLSFEWSQVSGPVAAQIDDTAVMDPVITFAQHGTYTFQVRVSDGPLGPGVQDGKETLVTTVVRVKNPATDDFLLAHWDMEDNGGTTVLDKAKGYNGVFADSPARDPNWVSGWIEGASPNAALLFHGIEVVDTVSVGNPVQVDIDPNVLELSDPNFADLQYEITAAAWIKVNTFDAALPWDAILTKGDHSWRLSRVNQNDTIGFFCNRPGLATARAEGTISVNDGQWHHIAGTYDGHTIKLYVDGILNVTGDGTGPIALDTAPVMIGGNADVANNFRTWNGMIDDARIYTYAMDDTEVSALAHLGVNLVPYVNAGPDQTFPLQEHELVLNATLVDDGKPAAADVSWSVIQTIPAEAQVTFISESTRLDPTIAFNMAGTYTLQVTADDGLAEDSDTITITVTSPTCADVIEDGLTMPVDVSGPEGGPDCKVDLYDLAEFARYWTKCNDPSMPGCDFPY
ncbi:MAG: LamG-like jellyroll fold domain-containing protein [Anaerohalosphaeraceae bacterium]